MLQQHAAAGATGVRSDSVAAPTSFFSSAAAPRTAAVAATAATAAAATATATLAAAAAASLPFEAPPDPAACSWPPLCCFTGGYSGASCAAARCVANLSPFPCRHQGYCPAHNASEPACGLCGEPRG